MKFYKAFYFFIVFFLAQTICAQNLFEIIVDEPAHAEYQSDIEEILKKSEKYLVLSFQYQPKEIFTLRIIKSLDEFKKNGIPLWLSGFYRDKSSIIQPVEVLKSKQVLKKTLFIEYAHFFLDSLSHEKCPIWLNEILSLYYYYQFSQQSIPLLEKNNKLHSFREFTDLKKNLVHHPKSIAFFNNGLLFCNYMSQKYGPQFWTKLLKEIKKGKSFSSAFLKLSSKKPETIYEKELE